MSSSSSSSRSSSSNRDTDKLTPKELFERNNKEMYPFGWGTGNELVVRFKPEPKTGGTSNNDTQTAVWNWDKSFTNKNKQLIYESYQVFAAIRKRVESHKLKRGELLPFSRTYRASLEREYVELERKGGEEERMAQIASMQRIWHLFEIVQLQGQSVVMGDMLHWYQENFGKSVLDDFQEVFEMEGNIDQHVKYWGTVYRLAMIGHFDLVIDLLMRHSMRPHSSGTEPSRNIFTVTETVLQEMPLFEGQRMADFLQSWRKWQEYCRKSLDETFMQKEFEVLYRILSGDRDVLEELKGQGHCDSWLMMLVAQLLFWYPTSISGDLHFYTTECLRVFGKEANSVDFEDRIMLDVIDFEVGKALRDCTDLYGDWWMVTHLGHLLHHAGSLEDVQLGIGMDLHVYLLLEYANSLMTDASLWHLGIQYYGACGNVGRQYIQTMVSRQQPNSDKEARKLLVICEQYGLEDTATSIYRVMGRRKMSLGRYVDAIGWFLKANDVHRVNQAADYILVNNLDVSDVQVLGAGISREHVLSSTLAYLYQFSQFQNKLTMQEWNEAGQILMNMLKEEQSPQKFWISLLKQAKDLMLTENNGAVVFGRDDTFKLMECLEDVLTHHQSVGKELTDDELEEMRWVFVKNLGRGIVQECSQ
eukprot:TRINITY_DN5692_c0_g1_i1.p1 TRINITY_DN5692_c0_g1~~TRINITY_DN5692_c0_g1_i1.p1  ORF type:complete len:658 (+),score=163.89 TRINITY_DN5692_c0_g1_i1:40-1974(+)